MIDVRNADERTQLEVSLADYRWLPEYARHTGHADILREQLLSG